MSKVVIGIISYFPEDKKIRNNRALKLKKLINQCNYIFNNLPIMIIAQNWEEQDFIEYAENSTVSFYKYDKLGIVGARNTLRKHFLESSYDYLIMLDDDVVLSGTPQKGIEYLKQLTSCKEGFWEFNATLLKLFAISKYLFEKEKFDETITPENGDGFEDRIFVNNLRFKYPNLRHEFKVKGLTQSSISTNDPDSTWYKDQNLRVMRENTNNKINSLNPVKIKITKDTKFNDITKDETEDSIHSYQNW